jgi:hypothetical protein
VLYIVVGYIRPEDTPERLAIIEQVNTDGDGPSSSAAAVAVPAPAPAGAGEDA